MKCTVLLTDDAVRDLEDIDDYLSEHDSLQSANYVLGKIEDIMLDLANLPDRGTYPKELSSVSGVTSCSR